MSNEQCLKREMYGVRDCCVLRFTFYEFASMLSL